MDILSVVATVFKRWYVTVPIVAVALATAFYMHTNLPPQFQAEGQILLASPDLDPAGLPRTIVNLGEVAGEAATASAQTDMVEGSAGLTITARARALTIDVSGTTAEIAEGTYANAVEWLGDAVTQRQDDAGIDVDEQLVLLQDGEAEVRERDEGGFEMTGRLGLVDPAAGAPNPFGANNATARILIVTIQSDAGQINVTERTGPGVGFSVGQDARDAAAILSITTSGADPRRVIEGYDHVADVLEAELGEREARAEVPETQRTRIERIAEPQRVTDTSPPLDRTVAAIIGLGGILAVIAATCLESVATRGRRRRDPAPSATMTSSDVRPWPADNPRGAATGDPEDTLEPATATPDVERPGHDGPSSGHNIFATEAGTGRRSDG